MRWMLGHRLQLQLQMQMQVQVQMQYSQRPGRAQARPAGPQSLNCLRNSRLSSLPLGFLGKASVKMMRLGTL